MKIDISSLKQIDRKEALNNFSVVYRKHNLVILSLFAGALIGYSLLRINSLNSFASSDGKATSSTSAGIESSPLVLQKISLNEDTVARLQVLAQDQDVEIDSSLPGNRDNPFDDGRAVTAPPAPEPEPEEENDNETTENNPSTDQNSEAGL